MPAAAAAAEPLDTNKIIQYFTIKETRPTQKVKDNEF